MIKLIKNWYRQYKCDHDWRIKGFGTMSNPYFISRTRRCCICKKIEYNSISKDGVEKQINNYENN